MRERGNPNSQLLTHNLQYKIMIMGLRIMLKKVIRDRNSYGGFA